MKTKQLPYRAGMPARSLAFFAILACLACGGLVTGCTDEAPVQLPDTPAASRPLQPGETCTVSLSVSNLPDLKEATTKAIPEGKQTELLDFTNSELTGRDRKRAGWISTEVRTEYGAEEEAATKAMTADRYFQNGSRFRLLVFKGPYNGTVNMNAPIENRVCRIDGNTAVFEAPSTSLMLLKGKYTFICFPDDERFNKWAEGQIKADGATVNIQKDDDFVYFKQADVELNATTYTLSLNSFIRQCYKLTVKLLISEDLGYLLKPIDKVPLQLSGANINTGVFNLKSGAFTSRTECTIENVLQVNGTGVGVQTFTAVENMLVPDESGSSKLEIAYPELTVLKPAGTGGSVMDSVFTIPAGSLVTMDALSFTAGHSYTVTLHIGEYVKGIQVKFKDGAGKIKKVIFAPGYLYHDRARGKWGIGREQCDYGYNEEGVPPNTTLPTSRRDAEVSYYFLQGSLSGFVYLPVFNETLTEDAAKSSGYLINSYTAGIPIERDPCTILGKEWRLPDEETALGLTGLFDQYKRNGRYTKTSAEFVPLTEDGKRMYVDEPSDTQGEYVPMDNRPDKTPVSGVWLGLSNKGIQEAKTGKYNQTALFLVYSGHVDKDNGINSPSLAEGKKHNYGMIHTNTCYYSYNAGRYIGTLYIYPRDGRVTTDYSYNGGSCETVRCIYSK